MPLLELPFRGRITKFIIVPICEIYNDIGPIDENKMKPITHYVGNNLDLKELASKLEDKVNEQLFSKIKTA